MDAIAVALAIGIAFGVMYALGEWIFRRLTGRLASRFRAGWRWLLFPATATVSFLAFLALRPLVLDRPPSLPVLVGQIVAIALLVTTGIAIASAVLQLLRFPGSDD